MDSRGHTGGGCGGERRVGGTATGTRSRSATKSAEATATRAAAGAGTAAGAEEAAVAEEREAVPGATAGVRGTVVERSESSGCRA